MSDWLPIETAPKVWKDDPIIGREGDGPEMELWWFEFGDCWWNGYVPCYPTHWRPSSRGGPPPESGGQSND